MSLVYGIFLDNAADWHASVEEEVSYFKENRCQVHMLRQGTYLFQN